MSFFRNWFYLYLKQTASEAIFESLICKLGEPYRAQYPFPGLRRVADFALHTRKIVIEIDGASHETLKQRRKDLVTTIALEKMGWRVIRFTNAEVAGWGVEFDLRGEIDRRLTVRPTLEELGAALLELPLVLSERAKPRGRRPKPGPKKAPKHRPYTRENTDE